MDPAKVEQWTACLARFEGSGLTVVGFCEKEGVSAASFYQWRRKLDAMDKSRREIDATMQPLASRRLASRPVSSSAFQAVEVLPAITAAATMRLPNGVEIELGGDLRAFDLLLERLLDGAHRRNGAASGEEGRRC